jgi:hypothetical protein
LSFGGYSVSIFDFKYKEIRTIIQDNIGKKIKFGIPKYCTTGTLKDSEKLQAIIKEDWGKLESAPTNATLSLESF